jgi:hypothetical protein
MSESASTALAYVPQAGRLRVPKTRTWSLATIGLVLALILTVFEGAIRKWILGGALGAVSYGVYLSKDVVFVAILLCRRQFPSSPATDKFRKYLIIGALFIACGSILSSVQGVSLVGAGLTLRSMLVLPAVALLLIQRLPPTAVKPVAWIASLAALFNAVLSVVQTRLPADHILNQYAVSEMQVVTLETGVRAAGTFAYITGLGVMSTVALWAGLSMMSFATSFREKLIGWVTIAAGFTCALASVSRAPLIVDVLMIIGWAAFARLAKQRVLAVIVTAAVVLTVAAASGILPTVERLSGALLERAQGTDDTFTERAFGETEEAAAAAVLAPLGNGLGFEQVGGNYFSTGQLAFANFESQFPRIVMDTTVLGLVGYIIMCVGALYALQVAKRGASASNRALILTTQVLLASIFYGSEVYNHTASSFGWGIFAAAMATQNVLPRAVSMVQGRQI